MQGHCLAADCICLPPSLASYSLPPSLPPYSLLPYSLRASLLVKSVVALASLLLLLLLSVNLYQDESIPT